MVWYSWYDTIYVSYQECLMYKTIKPKVIKKIKNFEYLYGRSVYKVSTIKIGHFGKDK